MIDLISISNKVESEFAEKLETIKEDIISSDRAVHSYLLDLPEELNVLLHNLRGYVHTKKVTEEGFLEFAVDNANELLEVVCEDYYLDSELYQVESL